MRYAEVLFNECRSKIRIGQYSTCIAALESRARARAGNIFILLPVKPSKVALRTAIWNEKKSRVSYGI